MLVISQKKKLQVYLRWDVLVEGYAKRFQVQERLTTQIAQAIEEVLDPEGTIVMVEAKHMCMCSRGIKKANAVTTTSSIEVYMKTDPICVLNFIH